MKAHMSIPDTARFAALAIAFSWLGAGCTTTGWRDTGSATEQRKHIDAGVDATLSRLYEAAPESRQLVAQAAGVLVFPSVLSVGFGVGAEHGNGALRVAGRTGGYYETTAGSLGFQAGAQSKAMVVLFMTGDSLTKFRNASGWTAGVDATVAVAEIGANGSIDTYTVQQPVVGFVLNNAGLMAGVSLQGSKISRMHL
jgi:lipid-binding SYLF domain-containing protein